MVLKDSSLDELTSAVIVEFVWFSLFLDAMKVRGSISYPGKKSSFLCQNPPAPPLTAVKNYAIFPLLKALTKTYALVRFPERGPLGERALYPCKAAHHFRAIDRK